MAARRVLNDTPYNSPTQGVRGSMQSSKNSAIDPPSRHGAAVGPRKMQTKTMSTSELKATLDRLALELQERQQPGNQDRDLNLFSDAVHTKMDELLAGNLAGNSGPLAVRQLFKAPATWGPVLSFLERTGFAALVPVEKAAVYSFLAELVVRHAYQVSRRSRAPLSPKLVASCSGNLGGLFEREFPGYLRSGLARIVARSICAPRPVL